MRFVATREYGAYSLASERDQTEFVERVRRVYGVSLPLHRSRSSALREEAYSRKHHLDRICRDDQQWVVSFLAARSTHCFLLPPSNGRGLTAIIDARVAIGFALPKIRFYRLLYSAPLTDAVGAPPLVSGQMLFRPSSNRRVFVADDVILPLRDRAAAATFRERLSLVHMLFRPPELGGVQVAFPAKDALVVCARPLAHVGALPDLLEDDELDRKLGYSPRVLALRSLDAPEAPTVLVYLSDPTRPRRSHRDDEQLRLGDGDDEEDGDGDGDDEEEAEEEDGDERRPAEEAVFYVRATNVPDVYELYASMSDALDGLPGAPIAAIPSMHDSRLMREAARGLTPTRFQRSPGRFDGRWTVCVAEERRPGASSARTR